MQKVFFITNIPTPYRSYFYNKLSKKIDIEVLFMDYSEPGRFWSFDSSNIEYKYKFFNNFGIKIRNIKFHFNPSLIYYIYRNKPSKIIIAGSWNFPTNLILVVLKPLFKNIEFGFWNEGNLIEEKYSKNNIIKRLKKYFYTKCDFFCSSGIMSDELIQYYNSNPKIIRLYNVINERIFENKIFIKNSIVDIFIVARLIELKNVFNYIKACSEILKQSNARILIAGEGEEKGKILQLINDEGLDNKVLLLGQLSENEVAKYLKDSQIFCLPSVRESFPLSVIEAMFASKPLLLSNRIGSLPECLNQSTKVNGYAFDPLNLNDMAIKTQQMIQLVNNDLKKMGENSYLLAQEKFNSESAILKFKSKLFIK